MKRPSGSGKFHFTTVTLYTIAGIRCGLWHEHGGYQVALEEGLGETIVRNAPSEKTAVRIATVQLQARQEAKPMTSD